MSYAKAEASHPNLFNEVADHIVMLDQLNDFSSNMLIDMFRLEVNLTFFQHKQP